MSAITEAKVASGFYLVELGTLVQENGTSAAVEVPGDGPRLFVCTLVIHEHIEQESLEVSLWGSSDAVDWGTQPILKLPQRFYRGTTKMVLDLRPRPEIRWLQARWDVNRWGRGQPQPRFKFDLHLQPAERP